MIYHAPEGVSVGRNPAPGGPVNRLPVLMVAVGRGRVGKTTTLNIIGQYFRKRGASLHIWNIDPHTHSGSLNDFFKNVEVPPFDGLQDRGKWLEAKISEQGRLRYDALLDVGGGDLILSRMADTVNLNRVTERLGVRLVMIHVLGTDPADLDHFKTNWANKVAGCATVIILNGGLLDADSSALVEFEHVVVSEPVVRAHERGARSTVLPLLGCMPDVISRRLSFDEAADGVCPANMDPISPFDQERIYNWWNDEIPSVLNKIPAEWLPDIARSGTIVDSGESRLNV